MAQVCEKGRRGVGRGVGGVCGLLKRGRHGTALPAMHLLRRSQLIGLGDGVTAAANQVEASLVAVAVLLAACGSSK